MRLFCLPSWRTLGISLLCVEFLTGCHPSEHQLGAAVPAHNIPVVVAKATNAGAEVVVSGTMVQKCPMAGCWFVLQDESGTIKVDTKNSGFVVVDVPLRTRVTAGGHLTTNGTERLIEATGVRY